jgi:hypothetical protein
MSFPRRSRFQRLVVNNVLYRLIPQGGAVTFDTQFNPRPHHRGSALGPEPAEILCGRSTDRLQRDTPENQNGRNNRRP